MHGDWMLFSSSFGHTLPPSIQETLFGAWKIALGNGCGNCMCFHPEFAPLPELVEKMVAESELVAFNEAGFSIQWALTEEEARLRRRASLTKLDVNRELLRARYLLWLVLDATVEEIP